jgi:hypothetical protein
VWEETWPGVHGPCPKCGSNKIETQQALSAILSFESSLAVKLKRALDAVGLAVLGLLLAVGSTVGVGIGFDVGGWEGAVAGAGSGLLVIVGLSVAIRVRPTRNLLARWASWVLPPDD